MENSQVQLAQTSTHTTKEGGQKRRATREESYYFGFLNSQSLCTLLQYLENWVYPHAVSSLKKCF